MAWACRFANLGVTPSASVIWLLAHDPPLAADLH